MRIVNTIVGIIMLIAFCCEGPMWITGIGIVCMIWLMVQAVRYYGWPERR